MATVLDYRRRALPGAGDKDLRSAAAGYELGRLLLRNVVDGRAHRAGCDYAALVDSYQRIKGYPSPFPRGMDIGAVRGQGLYEEASADVVRRISNDYMRVTTALSDAGTAAMREVREVCIFDREPVSVDNLMRGLGALADFFRIPAGHVDDARKSV
ncbi:hypothetical protein [Xanthobacter autotrophicus]|uniref:hypothetical protein n=1 Tax=Xanthobacter autotrophicus TaxID=280 RepID=UPI00372C8E11